MQLSRSQCKTIIREAIDRKLDEDIENSCHELPELYDLAADTHASKDPKYHLPGFPKLSEALGGIGAGGTTIITGGTGLGKSTLIGNIWCAYSALRKTVYTVPIEIGPVEFMDMLFSIIASKQRRTLSAADYEAARKSWFPQFFSNRGHVIAKHESRLSHMDFLAEVYYHHMTRGVSAAIGDNWNFMMEPTSGNDANAANDRALHDIITFTKIFPVHIWMIMHPRKDPAKKEKGDNRVTSLDDIKGSSTSPQEAANVLLFNALEDPKNAPALVHPNNCREIMIAKARFNGRSRGLKVVYHVAEGSELYQEHKTV